MAQERPRVRMEKKQYFDRNIWDMLIDIAYFVLDILQVGISRSTYYISFERMCLTVYYGQIQVQRGFLCKFSQVQCLCIMCNPYKPIVLFVGHNKEYRPRSYAAERSV